MIPAVCAVTPPPFSNAKFCMNVVFPYKLTSLECTNIPPPDFAQLCTKLPFPSIIRSVNSTYIPPPLFFIAELLEKSIRPLIPRLQFSAYIPPPLIMAMLLTKVFSPTNCRVLLYADIPAPHSAVLLINLFSCRVT